MHCFLDQFVSFDNCRIATLDFFVEAWLLWAENCFASAVEFVSVNKRVVVKPPFQLAVEIESVG